MKEVPVILTSLMIRLFIAGIICWVAWVKLEYFFIVAMPFVILVAAFIVAKPLAQLLGSPVGSLFYPNAHFDRPQPIYSIPEARRKEGRFEEAMAGYQLIVDQHPHELKAWIQMIDIAASDLNDRPRAETILQRGLVELKKPEEREHLSSMCEVFITPQKQPIHRIAVEDNNHA